MRRMAVLAAMVLAASGAAKAAPWADDAMIPGAAALRNEGLPGLRLRDLSGKAGGVVIFGHAFRQGVWPQGYDLTATAGGAALRLQTDIKARWPDGSVRHAILSIAAPGGASADVRLGLTRAGGAPTGAAVALADLPARGLDFALEIAPAGGAPTRVLAADLLREALARNEKPWLSGPLASEIRGAKTLPNGLTIIMDIRAQADGAVRISASLNNDALPVRPAPDLTYDVRLTMGGQTLYEKAGFRHRRFSAWRKVVWAGAAPEPGRALADFPALIAAGALPGYDPELTINEAFFAEQARALKEAEARGDLEPMGAGTILKAMPTTGGRADIGMQPAWALAHLRLQSMATRRHLIADAEAAQSIPWRFRDGATGRPPRLDDWPKLWLDDRATPDINGHGPIVVNVDGWNLDNAHQPEPSALAYLLTGDRAYLDDLKAQQAYSLLRYNPEYRGGAAGNLRNDELRGQAWANRTHAALAYLAPDDDPDKAYLSRKLDERLNWYATAYPADDNLGGPRGLETEGWIQGDNPAGIVSNWQQEYFLMSLAQASRMGFSGRAVPVYRYMRPYLLNRFLRDDFNPRWSTSYHYYFGDKATRAPFATWRQVAEVNQREGEDGGKPAFDPNPAHQAGDFDKAWNFAAQARAGYAAGVSAFFDPGLAEAYAWLSGETVGPMLSGENGFARYPEWSMVPVFPDGSTLALSRHAAGGPGPDAFQGDEQNRLFMGYGGDDQIMGGPGNEILAGWDGNDQIRGGEGYNMMAGGRGDDLISLEGGVNAVSGGPGADVFYVGFGADWGVSVIWDFNPREDALAVPAASAEAFKARLTDSPDGAMIDLGEGARLTLRGVKAAEVKARLREE